VDFDHKSVDVICSRYAVTRAVFLQRRGRGELNRTVPFLTCNFCYNPNMDNIIRDMLSLEYYGPKVEEGRMSSYDTAAQIIAFSDFVGILSRVTFGEKIQLNTEIQGFRGDSFDIDFVYQIAVVTAALTAGAPLTPAALFSLLKDSIKAWIHLKGKPPKNIEYNNEQTIVSIENNHGSIAYFNNNVINVISDPRAGKAAEDFIKKPLEAGISALKIKSNQLSDVADIDDKDAPAFIPIDMDTPLIENTVKMSLEIVSPTFKEGNKWKFNDGSDTFLASIRDQDFLDKVDRREVRFGKGDRLAVDILYKQLSSAGKLKMEKEVIKVHSIEEATEQNDLF